jgi:hypothetical protein
MANRYVAYFFKRFTVGGHESFEKCCGMGTQVNRAERLCKPALRT